MTDVANAFCWALSCLSVARSIELKKKEQPETSFCCYLINQSNILCILTVKKALEAAFNLLLEAPDGLAGDCGS